MTFNSQTSAKLTLKNLLVKSRMDKNNLQMLTKCKMTLMDADLSTCFVENKQASPLEPDLGTTQPQLVIGSLNMSNKFLNLVKSLIDFS
jgi:hypothetical protein